MLIIKLTYMVYWTKIIGRVVQKLSQMQLLFYFNLYFRFLCFQFFSWICLKICWEIPSPDFSQWNQSKNALLSGRLSL